MGGWGRWCSGYPSPGGIDFDGRRQALRMESNNHTKDPDGHGRDWTLLSHDVRKKTTESPLHNVMMFGTMGYHMKEDGTMNERLETYRITWKGGHVEYVKARNLPHALSVAGVSVYGPISIQDVQVVPRSTVKHDLLIMVLSILAGALICALVFWAFDLVGGRWVLESIHTR